MQFRKLALLLLNENYGINGVSEDAWEIIASGLEDEGNNNDILEAVEKRCDRYFLPYDIEILS